MEVRCRLHVSGLPSITGEITKFVRLVVIVLLENVVVLVFVTCFVFETCVGRIVCCPCYLHLQYRKLYFGG